MYKEKFAEITKLEDGDKLARDSSGVYYRHEKGLYFIQLRRWWTNQGREHTFQHLDEDFTEFMKYLDTILRNLEITYEIRYRELGKNLKKSMKISQLSKLDMAVVTDGMLVNVFLNY